MYKVRNKETFHPVYRRRHGSSRVLFMLCLLCAINAILPNVCSAANHYIRDGASGNGSDWTNAWDALPATLVRGDTYYIADGIYGSYSFNDAVDGEKYIYIKKAIESDHGTNTGWNSSYGDGQAVFINPVGSGSHAWKFTSNYWIVDGQVGGGPNDWDGSINPLGFKVTGPTDNDTRNSYLILLGDGWSPDNFGDYVEIHHVEVSGEGYGPRGADRTLANPYRNFGIVCQVNNDLQTPASNGAANVLVKNCYLHDLHMNMFIVSTVSWVIEENLLSKIIDDIDGLPHQQDGMKAYSPEHLTIRNNCFENIDGSGAIWMCCGNQLAGEQATLDLDVTDVSIYGNVFANNDPRWQGSDVGTICVAPDPNPSDEINGLYVYNNAFINLYGVNSNSGIRADLDGDPSRIGTISDFKVYNNIFYDVDQDSTKEYFFEGVTDRGYNWFYDCDMGNASQHKNEDEWLANGETNGQIGTGNPFVDWQNRNFHLISPTMSGLTLAHPNDVKIDMMGVTRGSDVVWDRGAIEYVSGSADTTPPTIISVTVHSPVHILFSEPLDVNSATNISNYTIDPNITIYSATLEEDLRTVTLITSAFSENVYYSLEISGIKDVSGNTMVPKIHNFYFSSLIADAGSDQTLTDTDGDGSAQVTLDGSASNNPNGAIVSWVWTDDLDNPIPDVEIATATLSIGTHTITLTVTDEYGATDTDTMTVTVNAGNQAPTADAGTDQTVTDTDGNGSESVTLDASNSDDSDGTVTSYVWSEGATQIATGQQPTIALNVNTHIITLTVTDDDGATDTDTVTVTVNPGNQAPTADAGTDQTLTDDDGNGSEPVTLDASGSGDWDGTITSYVWSEGATQIATGQQPTVTLNVGTHVITLTVTDDDGATDTDTVTITVNVVDTTAPTVTNLSPQADTIQTPLNTLVILNITDSGDGVDADSVTIEVNGNVVYTGNTAKYSSASGECYRVGTAADYEFIYQSNEIFNFDQFINVTANASDLAGNVMDEYSYSFQTEMRSFGKNILVDSDDLTKGGPVTVRDSGGNIWVVWHAGTTSNKDIYINKLTAGSEAFGNSIKLTDSIADQRNPAIALGSDDKLYVAWQDSRGGNWDIYVSTSTDGVNFSAETRVTDSNDNEINPAIIVDNSIPNNAYIVWEDSRNGNQDIYIGVSNNGFVSKTTSQITSDLAYQGEPAIAVDSGNTVYVVWTDRRITGKNNIYGAASNSGPWTNIPIVTEDQSQSSPVIATEAAGSVLHLVWVDDRDGENDIYYAQTSNGLPASPLSGSNIIDDTTNADQKQPVIAVAGSTGSNLQVFACWYDERNEDDDLYLAEISSGSGTNVFVGDDGTSSNQSEPAIGIDGNGQPYLVWTNDNLDIYYAGSTTTESDILASGNISTSTKVTLGIPLNDIDSIDDISVEVPSGAYSCEIEITISKVKNPPHTSKEYLSLPYEFGPSGIEFDQPVTITIPYEIPVSDYSVSAYWNNPLTGIPSQEGITDVETIVISSTLYALRFKTTHFTQFFVGGSSSSSISSISGGGGGGGGCSMSPDSHASAVELMLPYIGLTVAMVILKLRDRRKIT